MNEQIKGIIIRSLREPITDEEQLILERWGIEHADNQSLLDDLKDPEKIAALLEQMHAFDQSKAWDQVRYYFDAPATEKVHRIHFLRRNFGWVAAAILLVMASASVWFFMKPAPDNNSADQLAAVVAPDKNRARLTLANGDIVYLDSMQNGSLATEGNTRLVKLEDGKIAYLNEAGASVDATNFFNTLSNPRGSQPIDIGLSDGSHVWLNAGSSITYPVAFVKGRERKVAMTGEAYFEVAKLQGSGFTVENGITSVQVLGTHFNIRAYHNQPALKVTLLEGSVRVQSGIKEQMLTPGEQAVVTNNHIGLEKDVNLDDVMAWKNGFTSFHSAKLGEILRELENWYNISIEIIEQLNTRMTIDVPRNVPLKDVLKTLLDDHGIKYVYDTEQKKLIIEK